MAAVLASLLVATHPFAVHMVREHCDTPLAEGTAIMGAAVRRDLSGFFSIKVRARDGTELRSGDVYRGSDAVVVSVEPKIYQCVLEVVGISAAGSFEKGGCEGGVRSNQCSNATLHFTAASMGKLTIKAAYAKGYASGVFLVTEEFKLFISGSDGEDGPLLESWGL